VDDIEVVFLEEVDGSVDDGILDELLPLDNLDIAWEFSAVLERHIINDLVNVLRFEIKSQGKTKVHGRVDFICLLSSNVPLLGVFAELLGRQHGVLSKCLGDVEGEVVEQGLLHSEVSQSWR